MKMIGWFLVAGLAMAQQQTAFKPVASNAQLMRAFIIPSSDVLFNVGLEPPKDAAGWTAIENHALILAEAGNLLMMAPRAKDDVWMKESQALVEAGEAALKAAQAKNVDQLSMIADQMLEVCERCHAKYLR